MTKREPRGSLSSGAEPAAPWVVVEVAVVGVDSEQEREPGVQPA